MSARIKVRDLLNNTTDQLNRGLNSSKTIVYEDGEHVDMKPQAIKLNRYFWGLFSETDIKITSEFNVENFYIDGYLGKPTLNSMLELFQKELIYKSNFNPKQLMKILDKKRKEMVDIHNDIYSNFIPFISEYYSGLNIEDLLEVINHPDLIASTAKVAEELTPKSIVDNHKVADTLLRSPQFDNNALAIGYRSGINNRNQVLQCIAAVGHRADLDGKILPVPIPVSFTEGNRNLYGFGIESRTASKALNMAGKAIQTTEYLARELELLAMTVEKVIYTDCGSKHYEDWYIRPAIPDVHKCDLPNLIGKYYLDVDGVEKVIKGDEKHLIGTTIKMRTVEGCKLKNRKHVCSKCFGRIAYSIPKHSNLGHICITTLMKLISQSVLSTKHLVTSAVTKPITLNNLQERFFKVYKENGLSILKKWMGVNKRKLKIKIPYSQVYNIKEIEAADSIKDVDVSRVSTINNIYIEATEDGRVEDYIPVDIREGNRYGMLEQDFLEYIIKKGFTIDENDMVVFDLSDWNSVKPIITLPKLEFSFQAFAEDIKRTVRSKKFMHDNNIHTPAVLKSKLFDLINSKLDINLAVIEIIVYALTVRDLENHDFRLGRGAKTPRVVDMKTAISNRSFGTAAAWEDLLKNIFSPFSFIGQKESTPLDVFLTPTEHAA